ncbi:MAG: PorT family protein [Bacteroidaceae bacterium]|nr:PorT family protein [Bacteroidaceae bacterium]
MKRILCLLPLLVLALTVRAQVGEYRRDLAVGFGGGYVLNKVSFNPTINQSYHGGLTFGATVRYTCEKYYSLICAIQAELNFTQFGWKEKIETSTDTYSRTVNYFQLPVFARIGFGRERKGVQGYLVLGPQIAFYVSDSDEKGGEWSAETLSKRPNNVIEQYFLPIQKKFEYGICGGLGIEVSNPKVGHFQLEGRYYFGLSSIFNDSKADRFTRSANGAIIAKVTWLYDVIRTKNPKIR